MVIAASACGSGTSPTPPGTSSTVSPGQTGAATAGTLAAAGRTVYTGRCAGCHGDNGQGRTGPAVIGSGAQLAKYNTAGGLYDKISTTMPATAPGSLSSQDYLSVTAYLLVQDGYVGNDTQLTAGQLDGIPLK